MHGIVDEKIDVFAFGVLLLELITGRRAVDSTRQSLVMWVGHFPQLVKGTVICKILMKVFNLLLPGILVAANVLDVLFGMFYLLCRQSHSST